MAGGLTDTLEVRARALVRLRRGDDVCASLERRQDVGDHRAQMLGQSQGRGNRGVRIQGQDEFPVNQGVLTRPG